jgi:hypothetical protein
MSTMEILRNLKVMLLKLLHDSSPNGSKSDTFSQMEMELILTLYLSKFFLF